MKQPTTPVTADANANAKELQARAAADYANAAPRREAPRDDANAPTGLRFRSSR